MSKKTTDYNKWDKIAKEEVKKVEEEEEKNDILKWMQQQLYKNLDEDGRRAMNKSFSESGGRTLSTNWSEIKDKKIEDYNKEKVEEKKIEGKKE